MVPGRSRRQRLAHYRQTEMICESAEISAGHSSFLIYLKARTSLSALFLSHQTLSLITFCLGGGIVRHDDPVMN